MIEEMKALEKNGMWELMKRSKGKTPIECKWVFTMKYNSNDLIERYKARLVAKGFTQTLSIDYQDMFFLAAKLNTIQILLYLAANYDWPL